MKKNIMIFPSSTNENEYLQSMALAWEQAGFNVCFFSLKNLLKFVFYENKYIYINWIENQTRERGVVGLFLILGFCFLLKVFRIRIVWVRHNRLSHNLNGRFSFFLNKIAILFMGWVSFRVFCHGLKSAKLYGDYYVPHPLYGTGSKENQGAGNGYLIFGKLTPYKGIEDIIRGVGCVSLSIWGKFDTGYFNSIKSDIDGYPGTIDVRDEYIPNDELDLAISNCKAVLIGNDADSVIISGVVYRALELGAVVITKSKRLFEEVGNCRGLYLVSSWACVEQVITDDYRIKVQELNSNDVIVTSILSGINYDLVD